MTIHSAAGSAAGYLYQFERVLFRLAKGKTGDVVGIEVGDDVRIVSSDGELSVEENKHSVRSQGHPFGDTSDNLWKTLRRWITACQSGTIDVALTSFFLVTNRPVPACLARQISDADNDATALACITAIQALRTANIPADAAEIIDGVLSADPSLLCQLFVRVTLIDGTAGSDPDDRLLIVSALHLPPELDANSIVNELSGWIVQVVLEQWRARAPAWISRTAFDTQYHAVLNYRRRARARERSARLLPVNDNQLGAHRARVFVRQVESVTDDEGEVNDAIREYLQAATERLRLTQEGDVTREDWSDFGDRLITRWRNVFRRMNAQSNTGSDPSKIGHEVLFTTTDHRESLAGEPTQERYLTAGTYHAFADDSDVGWHPDFKTLFPKRK